MVGPAMVVIGENETIPTTWSYPPENAQHSVVDHGYTVLDVERGGPPTYDDVEV
jgi:hypothetical protein